MHFISRHYHLHDEHAVLYVWWCWTCDLWMVNFRIDQSFEIVPLWCLQKWENDCCPRYIDSSCTKRDSTNECVILCNFMCISYIIWYGLIRCTISREIYIFDMCVCVYIYICMCGVYLFLCFNKFAVLGNHFRWAWNWPTRHVSWR